MPLDPHARLYFFAGAQHGNWRFAERGPYQNCGNPLDHRPPMRALLLALDAWVTAGHEPPASVYPTLEAGTFGSVADYRRAFPKIPGIALPSGNLKPPRLDLGPRFASQGIADKQPPEFGPPYVTRVPLPDADGNDLGGIRLPAIAVPVGTYTGWNLRRPEIGAPDELARWSGSFIPFASDETTRATFGDPRPSLAARYASRDDYRMRIEAAARALARRRFPPRGRAPGDHGTCRRLLRPRARARGERSFLRLYGRGLRLEQRGLRKEVWPYSGPRNTGWACEHRSRQENFIPP